MTDPNDTPLPDMEEQDIPAGEGAEQSPEETSAEGQQATDTQEQGSERQAKEKPAAKRTVDQRIAELTWRMREAERRAEAAERAAQLHRPPQDDTKGAVPDPSKYELGELDPKYTQAVIQHTIAKETERLRTEQASRMQEATKMATVERNLRRVREEGAKAYQDFEEKVIHGAQNGEWDVPSEAADYLLNSPNGAHIAYYLASNPHEAVALSGMTPYQQAVSLARIELLVDQRKSSMRDTRTTKAPPPVAHARGSSGKFAVAPDTDDFSAFEKQFFSAG